MRFVIYGAGAIGGVTGALLVRARHEVVLIARGAHHDAIAATGLVVETPDETFTVRAPVVDHPSRIAWRADDVVLLAVKTQDVEMCARDLAALAPEVAVVCLTNGIAAERIAARHLERVHGACVYMPATHMTPGIVQAWSWPLAGAIDIGRYPHGAPDVQLVAQGLSSESSNDIMRMKRGKLLSNLANGAEALAGRAARNSDLARRAQDEARACFAAAGLSLPTAAEEEHRRAGILSRPIGDAARAGGSTWQSLARGHALEVDYLNGEIAMLGRIHGIPTPVNTGLQRLANAAARAGAQPGALALADLEARLRGSAAADPGAQLAQRVHGIDLVDVGGLGGEPRVVEIIDDVELELGVRIGLGHDLDRHLQLFLVERLESLHASVLAEFPIGGKFCGGTPIAVPGGMRGSGTAVHVGVGAAVIAAVALATIFLPLGHWVDALVDWTRHAGVLGLAGFSLAFLLLTVTMLPTVEMYVGAGLVYGAWWGTLIMTVLSVIGAMLAFWIARTSLRTWIEHHIHGNGTLEHVDRGIGEHSFWLATLLRISPVLPYGPTNYALAATRISAPMYAFTALVGTAPTNLLYAYAGSLLHKVTELDAARAPGHEVLLWGGVFATLALSVLLGWIAKRALAHAAH